MEKARLELILKVFLLSGTLSVLIKYGGPWLQFTPTNLNALIAISLPPLVVLSMLIWRNSSNSNPPKTPSPKKREYAHFRRN